MKKEKKQYPSDRNHGLRTKKNGQIVKSLYIDLPVFYIEKLGEMAKKENKNKNFLVSKALDLLFSSRL